MLVDGRECGWGGKGDKVEKGRGGGGVGVGDSRMCRSPGSEEQPFWELNRYACTVCSGYFVKALVG